MQYSFSKRQHLCGDITIAELFKSGKAFISFPIRIVYRIMPREEGDNRPVVRVMCAAPKKYFKHAVDRNRYKRLLREAYRLQQQHITEVLSEKNIVMDLSLSAVHNKLPDFALVKEKVGRALNNIIDHL